MNTINEQYTNDQKIQLYLNRVSDLFSQIKTWFKGELEVATDTIKVGTVIYVIGLIIMRGLMLIFFIKSIT